MIRRLFILKSYKVKKEKNQLWMLCLQRWRAVSLTHYLQDENHHGTGWWACYCWWLLCSVQVNLSDSVQIAMRRNLSIYPVPVCVCVFAYLWENSGWVVSCVATHALWEALSYCGGAMSQGIGDHTFMKTSTHTLIFRCLQGSVYHIAVF